MVLLTYQIVDQLLQLSFFFHQTFFKNLSSFSICFGQSESHTDVLHQRTNYTHASPAKLQAGHVVVMGPDDLMVSVAR